MGELSEQWVENSKKHYKTYVGYKDDIRYTRTTDYKTLYAAMLDWAGDDEIVTIKSLADLDSKNIASIRLVGQKRNLKFKQSPEGLMIKLGEKPKYDYAYPIRIKFKKPLK